MPAVTVISFVRPRGTYEAGFSGSVTVPEGVTCFQAWVQGAGGAGITLGDYVYGGGGGGFSYFYSDVLEAEWGTSLTLSVGSAVDDADGEASTLSGTLNGAAFSISAGGGIKTIYGGTASGGTTNISGYDGTPAEPPDPIQGTAGVAGGVEQDFVEPGGDGGLGSSAFLRASDGYIALEWG